MLTELRIENLGVIERLELVLPAGSIAVTGETGAGKTMIVGAIQLLLGERADTDMVRVGADEAVVEGRFVDHDGAESVVRRIIPADGRSRAYLDGSLATAAALAERVGPLVDLHGQHSQQSLLRPGVQRDALDRFGKVERGPLREARADVSAIDAALADLGGDATERARQIDLLRYQLDELENAALSNPSEDEELKSREDLLSRAFDIQAAATATAELLGGDGPVADGFVQAAARLGDDAPFADVSNRLQVLQEQASDLATDLRTIGEQTTDDPEAREAVRTRLQMLVELRRKYGPTLSDVIAYTNELSDRLGTLESHEDQVRVLSSRREAATDRLDAAAARVLAARRKASRPLARAVESELEALAMPNAKVDVLVDGAAGDDVSILLAPNPGMPALPVGKNASGGELSRTMLALRLVIAGGPPIKVFDEVDAGVGGAAAQKVGSALAALGADAQVFVVTHLPQVASQADHHVLIDKASSGRGTSSMARILEADERVVELSRMLSGSPDSSSAREHAEELLDAGARGSAGYAQ
ncbi:MAG: DNA repair protein RecN [Acidimicrobiales bacterium]